MSLSDARRLPAGLYVHVPFCGRVCPYCDFAVVTDAPGRRQRYLQALRAEIETAEFPHSTFDTVYLGGGTPSLLTEGELGAILARLSSRWSLPAPVITLEANPEDVDRERLARWRGLGIDVLSLGVQSFDDAELRFLGRAHDGAAATRSVEAALEAGFGVVSVDLIYGLPDQTPAAWSRNLARLLQLGPQHASCYQLTVHEGTRFGKQLRQGALTPIPDEQQAELFLLTHDSFGAAGWDAYEVSNFARSPASRSRHNQKYWRHAPYLGLGPSAHSYDGDRRRWWNRRGIRDWAAAQERGESPIEAAEQLSVSQWLLEEVYLGLRTSAGVDVAGLRNCTGIDLETPNRDRLPALVAGGLLEVERGRWKATRRGFAVAEWLSLQIEIPAD